MENSRNPNKVYCKQKSEGEKPNETTGYWSSITPNRFNDVNDSVGYQQFTFRDHEGSETYVQVN